MNNKNITDIAAILDGLRGYFYPHEWGNWDYIGSVDVTSTGTYELYSQTTEKLYLYGFALGFSNDGGGSEAAVQAKFDPDAGADHQLFTFRVGTGDVLNRWLWYPMPKIESREGDIDIIITGDCAHCNVHAYGHIET